MRASSFLMAVVGFMLSASTFGQVEKPVAQVPVYKVGEQWSFLTEFKLPQRNPTNSMERVERANDKEVWILRTAGSGERTWLLIDTQTGRWKSEHAFDPVAPERVGAVAREIQPNGNWLQFPLEIGKSYPVIEHWTNSQGHNGRSDLKAKVVSLEKIKLEGAEIDAFRIELSGWWNNLNSASSGKLERVAWYVPGIKQFAKREGKIYFNGQLQDHGITSVVEFKPVQ